MARTSSSLPPARFAVLDRIRRGDHTVNALADSLTLTDNAVRLHLSALERDGLLKRRGVKRTGQSGQPAAEYVLTSAGEIALSSAYPPALTAVVAAIGERLGARGTRALFLDAGTRLAEQVPSHPTGSVADRAHACAQLIESLGGSVSVKSGRGHATLTGAGCPLAGAVRAEPATCALIEALLARHADLRVVQKCDHGANPACKFELSSN